MNETWLSLVAGMREHVDAEAGAVIGAGAGLASALPPGAPWWTQWVGALILSLVPIITKSIITAINKRSASPKQITDGTSQVEPKKESTK